MESFDMSTYLWELDHFVWYEMNIALRCTYVFQNLKNSFFKRGLSLFCSWFNFDLLTLSREISAHFQTDIFLLNVNKWKLKPQLTLKTLELRQLISSWYLY